MIDHPLPEPTAGAGDPPRLALRPREAATALGVSPRKLWELTADRTSGIPVIRWGKCVVYPVRELADWLTQQAERGTL